MNQNLIENIIQRGGTEGWTTAENLDDLKKSFTFATFEQCQNFCQNVGVIANDMDHHPEWDVVDGGRTVNARLTSHFNNNKVTKLDFELAEVMNEQEQYTLSSYQ